MIGQNAYVGLVIIAMPVIVILSFLQYKFIIENFRFYIGKLPYYVNCSIL